MFEEKGGSIRSRKERKERQSPGLFYKDSHSCAFVFVATEIFEQVS